MTDVSLVGLSGYATAGKDTAAEALLNVGWFQGSFAEPLKEALYVLDPIVEARGSSDGMLYARVRDVVNVYDWDKAKKLCPEIRTLLQRMGTEVGRGLFGENFWVEQAMKKIYPYTVFTDVRFPNEAEAVREAGGLVIRINRDGTGPVNDHPSETALDDYRFDAYIRNDGSIPDLHRKVLDYVDFINDYRAQRRSGGDDGLVPDLSSTDLYADPSGERANW